MSRDAEILEVLIGAPTEAEASIIVGFLADRRIAARAVGGFTAGFRAEAPGDVSVLVKRADLERAQNALRSVLQ